MNANHDKKLREQKMEVETPLAAQCEIPRHARFDEDENCRQEEGDE